MGPGKFYRWLFRVLQKFAFALWRGEIGAIVFVLVAVPVILLIAWVYWKSRRDAADAGQVNPDPGERWEVPDAEEVARSIRPKSDGERGT